MVVAATMVAIVLAVGSSGAFFESPLGQIEGFVPRSVSAADVSFTAVLIAIEGLTLGLVLLWFSSMDLWKRAMLAVLLFASLGLQSFGSQSPMPSYLLVHHVWVWGVAATMTVVMLVSGYRCYRKGRVEREGGKGTFA